MEVVRGIARGRGDFPGFVIRFWAVLLFACVMPPERRLQDAGTERDAKAPDKDATPSDRKPPEDMVPDVAPDMGKTCPERPIPSEVPFADVTALWGIDFVHHGDGDQCEWSEELGPGVCVLDYDSDGDLDLYFVDMADHPNRLYRNDSEMFTDVTDETGVGDTGDGLGCLAFDYDSDGDPDLYVTNDGPDRLYRNDDGMFLDVASEVGIEEDALSMSATSADIDGNGTLDLFVARFVGDGGPDSCPNIPSRYRPLRNFLYVNEGGAFTEQSGPRGLVHEDPALVALFVDWDSDQDLDLWVGNDLGSDYPERLYQNDGAGYFVDQGEALGLAWDSTGLHSGCTMGVDVGDFDLDGFPDLISTNFIGRKTLFFDCDPGVPCVERSDEVGLAGSVVFFSWGIGFVDFDLDGDLDLFSASGSIFQPIEQRNALYFNEEGMLSEYVPSVGDALALERSSRGLAFGDLDGDGDTDIAVASTSGSPQILRNDAPDGLSLGIRPDPPLPGTRVTVRYADRMLTEQLFSGGGYLGNSEPVLRFGLSGVCQADVEVFWPGGAVATVEKASAGQVLTVPMPVRKLPMEAR